MFTPSDVNFLPKLERVFLNSSQAPQTFELPLISHQNEEIPLLVTVSSISLSGTVQGYIGVGIDLSSRKIIEDLRTREEAILRAKMKY